MFAKNNVVHATKYGCPDWALFKNIEKKIFEFFDFTITNLDGLSAMHWAALNDNVNLTHKLSSRKLHCKLKLP